MVVGRGDGASPNTVEGLILAGEERQLWSLAGANLLDSPCPGGLELAFQAVSFLC
jgi:hypothetical protein